MRKIRVIYIFPIALSLALLFGVAFHERQILTDRYNQGVQYYEDKKYRDAIEVFNSLRGWGNTVEISPEDYYNMALEKLLANEPDTIVCPNCGELIK